MVARRRFAWWICFLGALGCAEGGDAPADSGATHDAATDGAASDGGASDGGASDGGASDGGASDATTDGGPSLECEVEGQIRCGGVCVSTDTDSAHCGGCNMACDSGELCVAGDCTPQCDSGEIACDGACIDPRTDAAHCGASADCTGAAAGTQCTEAQACMAGTCMDVVTCPPATVGVAVGAVSGAAVEGGEAVTYTLALETMPCSDVVIALAADADVSVEPAMVSFTSSDWNAPRTIQVRAVADQALENTHSGRVTHTVTSTDPNYNGVLAANVDVEITDAPPHFTHVSVPVAGATGADGASVRAAISDDGRWVAFVSAAANLVEGDTAGRSDVFLRDLMANTTTRLSIGSDGTTEANGATDEVEISASGERVAFSSRATNLVPQSVTTAGEVYVWDQAGGVRLVTPTCAGCNNELLTFAMSGNGEFIAFSTRRRLLPSDTETELDIFSYRVSDSSLTHDSLNTGGGNGTNFWGSNAMSPTLSADGRFVGFQSAAASLASPEITIRNQQSYVKDRDTGTLERVSRHHGGMANCESTPAENDVRESEAPRISSDGTIAALESGCPFMVESGPTDSGAHRDIFVRNFANSTTTRISIGHDGSEADGDSHLLGMSDDARYLLFSSRATNIVAGDTNGALDLFVHDRTTGTTTRLTVSIDGTELAEGLHADLRPAALSRNGRFVVFATIANLAPTDANVGIADLYVAQVY